MLGPPRGATFGPMTDPGAHVPGLCAVCRHGRIVRSGRGTVFLLCRRSMTDRAYPKYPVVPVVRCHGFEADLEENEDTDATTA